MVATVIPRIRKRFAKSLATFWVVVGLLATGGGFALTSTTAVSAQQPTASWTHLGGDPLFPGGLSAIAAQQHFSLRDAYVFALTSPVGQSALATDGLSVAQREAVTAGARQGEFVSCSLIYGDVFQAMTYGANGVAVDHYVIFSDPRFKNHGSPAFCENIRVGNVVVHLLVPVVCANIALINMTPAPTPLVPVTITKVAESATGQVFPTPTGTFRFQVTAGGSEHVVLYQQANQLLGKYPVGSTVRVQELSTLGNGKWVTLSPDVQTVRLTKQPFLFVYKDQEAATPPASTTTTTTLPPPPVTTTTTMPPAQPKPPTVVFEETPPAFEAPYEGQQVQVCADATGPTGDPLLVDFSASTNVPGGDPGSTSATFQPDPASPQRYCTVYTAPIFAAASELVAIKVTVWDTTTHLQDSQQYPWVILPEPAF